MRPSYYHRDGTPIQDTAEKSATIVWAEMFEITNRRVCRTSFWWGGYLSTVFLGLDHRFGDGPPLIFESMLFGWPYSADFFGEFRTSNEEIGCWRYSSEKQAIESHSRLVRLYRRPWRAVGWKRIGRWLSDYFKNWERGYSNESNVWSIFEENNHPRETLEEMSDGFADGKEVYERSVKIIEGEFPAVADAWTRFVAQEQ